VKVVVYVALKLGKEEREEVFLQAAI